MKLSLIGCGLLATTTFGCVSAYKPPAPNEPHATLKVRRVYERSAGTHLAEGLQVDGHPAQRERVDVRLAEAPRASAILLHPKPTELSLESTFFHQEMRTVQEAYTVQVPYTTMQSQPCGYGRTVSTCSHMVTQYRSETRYRTVTRLVDVPDGTCRQSVQLAPAKDGSYLVDLTYRDHGVCHVSCVEQTHAKQGGAFDNRPCPAPPPKETSERKTRTNRR